MRPRLRHAAVALVIFLAACSGNPAPGATGSVAPPRILGNDHPDFQNIRPPGDSRTDISVMVGVDGLPDMTTLRVTGSGASAMHDAIAEWIARSRFEPATTNGVPVRAEYRTEMRTKVTVVRRS